MASSITARRARSAAGMAVGVAVVGVSGFGFLAIVGHTLSSAEVVAVTAVYMIINIVGPGLFYSLEQETARVVSGGLAAGVDPTPGLRRAAGLGLALAGGTAVLALAGAPILTGRLFGGHAPFLAWLVLGIAAAAMIYLVRGVLAGAREFGGYSVSLIVEGLARLLPCAAIALAGAASQDVFAAVFALGGVVAALAVLPRLRDRVRAFRRLERPSGSDPLTGVEVEESHRFGRIARGVGLLATATMLAQLVANLAPLVVTARLVDAPAAAGAFVFAFVLSRMPMLGYGPLQSMLLPALTGRAVREDHAAVRRAVRAALLAIAALGVPAVAGSALFGPWLVVTFFGAETRPSASVMALLTLSTMVLLAGLVLQPALVALGQHHTVSVAWIAGTAVLAALLAIPVDPVTGAVIAQLAGPAVVVALAAVGFLRASAGAQGAK
jgi:O-antigen/teichoic acid export membrane protein